MSQPFEYPRPPSSNELIYDDGEPMESARHRDQMIVLIESLRHAWKGREDFYVGGNMFLYFSETQAKKNDFRGPDVFVVLNTTQRERRAWVVWEEDGKSPDVIIELLSESTAKVDRGLKMQVYGRQLKVGEYILFDPFSGVLEGYELDVTRGTYSRKTPDVAGRLSCKQLGLSLGGVRSTLHGVDATWLRWLTPDGEVLELPVERANAATERANAATERAERLSEELAALKAKLPP